MRFAVITPDPAQWVHVRAFDEVAEVIRAGLTESGHECERSVGCLVEGRRNVVFGAHLMPAGTALPAGTVLYNLEQIVDGALWVTPAYLEALRRHEVWDYSARNCAALRARGAADARHVPLAPYEELEEACVRYLADSARRSAVAAAGRALA